MIPPCDSRGLGDAFKTNLRVGDIVMYEGFSGDRVGPYRIAEFYVDQVSSEEMLFAHIFAITGNIAMTDAHAWVLANRLSPVET